MPTHYIYSPTPSTTSLFQGDVLTKTPQLLDILDRYHPHYAKHSEYKYFVVLTQSCDLVRRDAAGPKSTYINLCPARPIESVIIREAGKLQTEWQRSTGVVGASARGKLSMILERIIDNNEGGLFYLHEDASVGIQQSCCAFLSLQVAFRAEHYETFLQAKIAELTDTFQAKIGWLIGNMFSRVGTVEWNHKYPDNKTPKVVAKLLDNTLVSIDDAQIKEGFNDIKNSTPPLSHDGIKDYILKKKIIPKSKKFEALSSEILQSNPRVRPISKIAGQVRQIVSQGLEPAIARLITQNTDIEQLAKQIASLVDTKIASIKDETFPQRDIILLDLIKSILQDTRVAQLFK